MNKRSSIWAFFALFLGWAAYKKFDFETFKVKQAIGYIYILGCLASCFLFFKGGKKED